MSNIYTDLNTQESQDFPNANGKLLIFPLVHLPAVYIYVSLNIKNQVL